MVIITSIMLTPGILDMAATTKSRLLRQWHTSIISGPQQNRDSNNAGEGRYQPFAWRHENGHYRQRRDGSGPGGTYVLMDSDD